MHCVFQQHHKSTDLLQVQQLFWLRVLVCPMLQSTEKIYKMHAQHPTLVHRELTELGVSIMMYDVRVATGNTVVLRMIYNF